ncbi:hypothetical protein ABZ897_00490 [Nonomuraea sp. NPDC046802]|uniref:hypothetical protein n=1 Tax=Nonomuraea sp. NPDC046802 TaxID=3154919 RepID=UPI00340D2FBC
MTSLDHTPLFAGSFAEIRERDERALKRAEDPAWSLNQAEADRADLLVEVDRLTSERDQAREVARNSAGAVARLSMALEIAERAAFVSGPEKGIQVIRDYLADAGLTRGKGTLKLSITGFAATTFESGDTVLILDTDAGPVEVDLGTEFAEPMGLLLLNDPAHSDGGVA